MQPTTGTFKKSNKHNVIFLCESINPNNHTDLSHFQVLYLVIGGYSHLVSSGHLPRFSFSWFCVPVYNVVFIARAASPRRSSRDRLLN